MSLNGPCHKGGTSSGKTASQKRNLIDVRIDDDYCVIKYRQFEPMRQASRNQLDGQQMWALSISHRFDVGFACIGDDPACSHTGIQPRLESTEFGG